MTLSISEIWPLVTWNWILPALTQPIYGSSSPQLMTAIVPPNCKDSFLIWLDLIWLYLIGDFIRFPWILRHGTCLPGLGLPAGAKRCRSEWYALELPNGLPWQFSAVQNFEFDVIYSVGGVRQRIHTLSTCQRPVGQRDVTSSEK